MIKISEPKFSKTLSFFEKLIKFDPKAILEKHGQMGVRALEKTTPKDSGETSAGWGYKIEGNRDRYKLIWTNNQVTETLTPIVLLIQYGHATKSGYFLSGRDIINPALRPVYDSLHKELMEDAIS